MALFPPNIWPETPPREGEDWETIVQPGPGGMGDVLEVNDAPVFLGRYRFYLERADFHELRSFHRQQRGPALPFDFFAYTIIEHELLDCGTGDGSDLVFPAPLTDLDRTLQAPVVTVGGASKAEGTDYEIIVEQRAAKSEDLSDAGVWAAVSGAVITRTGGQAAPSGPATAWRIQTSGGTDTAKLRQQLLALSLLSKRHLVAGYIKVAAATPAVTIADGLGATQTVQPGAGWTEIELQSDGDAVTPWLMEFRAPAAGDALDVDLWHPWGAIEDVYWGLPRGEPNRSAWRYGPSGASAIAVDSKRRHQIVFYAGSVPGAGAAVKLTAVGRRLYYVQCLTEKLDWAIDENLIITVPLEVKEST